MLWCSGAVAPYLLRRAGQGRDYKQASKQLGDGRGGGGPR